jgi:cell division protein FtsL
MHSRIEKIAAEQMQMQVPDAKRIQVVPMAELYALKPLPNNKVAQ